MPSMVLDSSSRFTHPSVVLLLRRRSLVQPDSLEASLLITSVGVVARSQYLEESARLRHKIDELHTDSVTLIARAEKLIRESEKLSAQVKALENRPPPTYS
jgi:outer membrane murein-binding lipoprotein Lpp